MSGGSAHERYILISIHVLREEDDPSYSNCSIRPERDFYPRPPRGGRRRITTPNTTVWTISIHVLREEDDQPSGLLSSSSSNFYPRPPRGGRRGCMTLEEIIRISIHVLREEDDLIHREGSIVYQGISIHVLREEDDDCAVNLCGHRFTFLSTSSARRTTVYPSNSTRYRQFLSTSSARRTTRLPNGWHHRNDISIHVLREEDDQQLTTT